MRTAITGCEEWWRGGSVESSGWWSGIQAIKQQWLIVHYCWMQEQQVYFEKQSFFSLQCGLYSVNHLLGKKHYSEASMNAICYELSDDFINPHKHPFGGDYDVNVLMVALARFGHTIHWFDARHLPFRFDNPTQPPAKEGQASKEAVPKGELVGLLINVQSGSIGILQRIFRISRRHWLAVRRRQDEYFWMNSSEDAPRRCTRDQMEAEINKLMQDGGNAEERPQILLVYKQHH